MLQTIVEVVNPVIGGDGYANKIAVGRSEDCAYPSFDGGEDQDTYERSDMSLNEKMKNVLQELLKNDKVKLNWSRSLEEDDDDNDEEQQSDDEMEFNHHQESNGNDVSPMVSHRENDNASLGEVKEVTQSLEDKDDEDIRNSNLLEDCQVYKNPNADVEFANESFEKIASTASNITASTEKLSAQDEKLKKKLLSQLHVVDELRRADNDGSSSNNLDGDETDTTATANIRDDESFHQRDVDDDDEVLADAAAVVAASAALTAAATETGKSTNSGKKKKRKGKNKKK